MALRRSTSSSSLPSDVVTTALRTALSCEVVLAAIAAAGLIVDRRLGAGALLGVIVSASFFAIGMVCVRAVLRRTTTFALVGALAVFVIQIYLLAAVGIALGDQPWWDPIGVAVGALVATLAWQAVMARAYRATRQPVYDVRSEGATG